MFIIIIVLFTNFILTTPFELVDALTQVQQYDPDRTKLNWQTFSQAMHDLLHQIEQAKDIEEQSYQSKSDIYQQLINLHDQTLTQIKIDIAKLDNKVKDQERDKTKLDEILNYRGGILKQQKKDLQNNEAEYARLKNENQQEIDDVSDAINVIDKMKTQVQQQQVDDNQANSFVELKESVKAFHQQINKLAKQDSPFIELADSLSGFLQKDFKERQVLKSLEGLLDQYRMIAIDYRISIVQQGTKNQELYVERRNTIQKDRQTSIELYDSKIEEYNSLLYEMNSQNQYIENRKKDQDLSANGMEFYRGVWADNEGIRNRVRVQLLQQGKNIRDALKSIGDGISLDQ